MSELLKDVIDIGGRALEAEDRQLRAIYEPRGQRGGLLRTDFERYYQFVVWRSLVAKYDAQIEFNRDGFLVDLVINQSGASHLFEMKNWREETTAKLSPDIRRLQNFRDGGYFLVFSANPAGMTNDNMGFIGRELSGIEPSPAIYPFGTENLTGKAYEFWFAGWRVRSVLPS